MTTKICTGCGEDKDLSQFYTSKSRTGKAYYKSQCKDCVLKARKKYQQENRESISERKKLHYLNNKEKVKAGQKVWRDQNLSNRLARNSKRRAAKLQATPQLTTKQEQQIKDFYWLAKDLSTITGESYHVDHIIPLQGKNVCGLHVPWNLQVLPADINLSKGNKHGNLA